jgi:hypothetical protein
MKRVKLEGQMTWDNSRLKRGLTESESIIRAGAGRITGILGAVGVGVGVAGLVSGLKTVAEQFDRIGKLSTRFGIGVEGLQRLGHAAELSGANIEQVAKAMNVLVQRSREANMVEEFAKLGIEVERFKRLNPEQMFMEFADAIANMSDKNEATAISLRLIGEEAAELMPLLNSGSEGIAGMTKGMKVLSDEGVRDIERFNDAITKLKTNLAGLGAEQLEGLIDALTWLGLIDAPPDRKPTDHTVLGRRIDPNVISGVGTGQDAAQRSKEERAKAARKSLDEGLIRSISPSGVGTEVPFNIASGRGFVPVGHGGDDFADGIHHPNPFAPMGGAGGARGGGLPFGLGPAIMAGGLAGMAGRRGGRRGLERLGLHRPTFRDGETYSRLDEMERAQDRSRAWDYSPDSSSAVAAMSGRDLAGSKEDVREERNAERFKNIEKATMKTAEILGDVEGD